jgi:hypothetical protein
MTQGGKGKERGCDAMKHLPFLLLCLLALHALRFPSSVYNEPLSGRKSGGGWNQTKISQKIDQLIELYGINS